MIAEVHTNLILFIQKTQRKFNDWLLRGGVLTNTSSGTIRTFYVNKRLFSLKMGLEIILFWWTSYLSHTVFFLLEEFLAKYNILIPPREFTTVLLLLLEYICCFNNKDLITSNSFPSHQKTKNISNISNLKTYFLFHCNNYNRFKRALFPKRYCFTTKCNSYRPFIYFWSIKIVSKIINFLIIKKMKVLLLKKKLIAQPLGGASTFSKRSLLQKTFHEEVRTDLFSQNAFYFLFPSAAWERKCLLESHCSDDQNNPFISPSS